MSWAKLDDGIVELRIFVEYKNGQTKTESYRTKEGNMRYYSYMKDDTIYFGRTTEVYEDGRIINRASFCHGK